MCGLAEWGVVVSDFFLQRIQFFYIFFFRGGGGGGGGGGKGRMYFSINWQERNPNLTKNLFFFVGGGGVKRGWGGTSNGTSTLQRGHQCKIILKSMHKCRSNGSEKLIYVTFKCDLDLQPT